jgi:general nucleoside transport system permease protein
MEIQTNNQPPGNETLNGQKSRRHFRLERRENVPAYWSVLTPILSIVLALLFAAVALAFLKIPPWETLGLLFKGAFGDRYGWEDTFIKAIPLMLTGLAVLLAFKMEWWNIGAEGQLFMGAVGATGVALFMPGDLPAIVLIPLMIAAGFIAGGLWASIAGLLQAYLGVNEIISTLMLNYVAIAGTEYLRYGPWADPEAKGYPQTAVFPDAAWLPTLPGTRVHLGIFMAIIIAGLIYLVIGRTRWGHEIEVIGHSKMAARYAGISIKRNIVLVAFISGGIAGLTGMAEVSGVIHKLETGLSPGYGFTAIIIAWLARLNPWAVFAVAILFSGILVGGDYIQFAAGVPASINLVLQGAMLFFVIIGEALQNYRVRYD